MHLLTTLSDHDECDDDPDPCHAQANCTNTVGSYECTCDDGFRGNGTDCTDVDECAEGTSDCDDNMDCVNEYGGYDCICKGGFKYNRKTETCNGKTCYIGNSYRFVQF